MKSYRTSFLGLVAFLMLVSASLFSIRTANATCSYFTVYSSNDTTWTFTAQVGHTQSRTVIVENTSDSFAITLVASVSGTSQFGLSWTNGQVTLQPHDTASLTITFQPPQGAANGTVNGKLTITKIQTDCQWSLGLIGTATGGTNGGGDKVVTLDPSSFVFNVAAGADTCQAFYLVNHTGMTVTVTSLRLVGTDAFSLQSLFNGATIDSGGSYKFTVCFKGNALNTRLVDSIIAVVSYGGAIHSVEGQILGYTSTPPPPVPISADPHEFTFGTVAFGTDACKNVIVTNTSKSDVILRYWGTCDSTGNAKDFSVSPVSGTPDTLGIGASITFTICYKPHEANLQASCNLGISYFGLNPAADGTLNIYFSGNSGTDSNVNPAVCLRTEQGDNYNDAIVVGTTANHTLVLINNSNHNINVTSATISGTDANVFAITSTFPIAVPANSNTTTLNYTFSPTSNDKNTFAAAVTLALTGDSLGCHSVEGKLIGFTVQSGNAIDSIVRPIFSNDHILAIEGSDNRPTSETFYFTNNLQVDCTVKNISVDSTQYFTITSTNPSPTPFVLHPGANLTVVVSFIATDHLVHHAHLIIDADHNLQSPTFDLEGLNNAAASVSNSLPNGVAITVSPNPATDYVTVAATGVTNAKIEMYDLLGKSVAIANTVNCKLSTVNFPAGSYIVRISGMSTIGEQFVSSKRIIVAK